MSSFAVRSAPFVLLCLTAVQAHAADRVLITPPCVEPGLKPSLRRSATDLLQQAVLRVGNLEVVAAQGSDCDGARALEQARAQNAHLLLTSELARPDRAMSFAARLHHVRSGTMVGSKSVEAASWDGLKRRIPNELDALLLEGLDRANRRSTGGNERAFSPQVATQLRACEGGKHASCAEVGHALRLGKGAPKDPQRCADLTRAACKGGDEIACNVYGMCSTDLGLHENAVLAFEASCGVGQRQGCALLAGKLINGEGVAVNLERADKLLQKSCDADWDVSCYTLGEMARDGKGRRRDVNQAAFFFARSCRLGLGEGCNDAGLLRQARSPFPDWIESAKLFHQGCEQKSANACQNLAERYVTGSGVGGTNLHEAERLFDRACAYGNQDACLRRDQIRRETTPAINVFVR